MSQRDWRDVHDHLVQKPDIGELPHQVSSADDPYVLASGRIHHLRVHRGDVRAREHDLGAGNDG